ncbi:hypothetical protein [uncultured Tolumonas sp.]|uniref:hypothetical protein n=1 Tax=uncultured Tolumonas sp. TaxID=263765 RepID=UPI00292ECCFE|nr:hypothetical protein [uncultured Tolumonas sp.]
MRDVSRSPVGIKTSIGASTGIGAVLVTVCNQVLPAEWKEIGLSCVPLFSPVLSYGGVYLYNRLIESPEVVAYKARLRRDLRELKSIIKDKHVADETREQARTDYSATRLLLANTGRNGIPGILGSTDNQQSGATLEESELGGNT